MPVLLDCQATTGWKVVCGRPAIRSIFETQNRFLKAWASSIAK
jgi:hypothetical protein